jgi:hypothetical protein
MSDDVTGTIDAPDNTDVQDAATDVTAETTAPANWIDSVPDEVKSNPEFEALLKDAEAYKGIERPPETPDGYKIEGMSPEALKEFGDVALSMGLNQKQAELFHKWAVDTVQKSVEAQKTKLAAARESLKTDSKKQLDTAYGKDSVNVEKIAREALTKWGDADLIDTLDKTGLIYHPSVLAAFYRIGSMVQPDVLVPSTGKQPAPPERNKSGIIDVQYAKT